MTIMLNVNGEERFFGGDGMTPLLDVLRSEFFLTGAKDVCRGGFCGACTVHIDGAAMAACLTPAELVEGKCILTIEGLGRDGRLSPLQRILEAHDVVQCGMCFPGMIMTMTALLKDNPVATRDEIKRGLAGNICRCTGYERVVDAVLALRDENERGS